MTNTEVASKTLQGRNFPLIFKICPQPGFKESSVFEQYGYKSEYKYFLGTSMFNNSQYGWAGHTNDSSGPLTSVEMVYRNVSSFNPEEIIKRIDIKLMNGDEVTLDHTHVLMQRVNYPLNCFTLDLTKYPEIRRKGLRHLTFFFKPARNLTRVQMKTQA